MRLLALCTLLALPVWPQSGPVPSQPDLPYLLHADSLIPTESLEAKQQQNKDITTYTIPGPTSPVRTPLASPNFLFKSDKITAENLQLLQLKSNGKNREIVFNRKKRSPESLTLTIKPLGNNVYRIEVNESLPNGEYVLTPGDSNRSFCFSVY